MQNDGYKLRYEKDYSFRMSKEITKIYKIIKRLQIPKTSENLEYGMLVNHLTDLYNNLSYIFHTFESSHHITVIL